MAIKPLADRVVILRDKAVTETAGGIALPPQAQRDVYEGIVVNTGIDVIELKVGDHVTFSAYGGKELTVDGIPYLVIEEKSIIAVVT